ncbi:MAG: FkbM family methyltransferase [Cyanobacteriota bacterium]|nr:FkbM family methyltransferase [Cyanobacteriota bacterium]
MLAQLAAIIHAVDPEVTFTIMEVGAFQLDETPEPFYELLQYFPGSQIIGFEADVEQCAEMNAKALPGVRYFPIALGARNETRDFYITNHPASSSFYEPNESLIKVYNNLEAAQLNRKVKLEAISMDHFAHGNGITTVDFIKIDVQGAELDVFHGGIQVLKNVLAIVCEVEFIPQYLNQPLFGDVCAFLDQHHFMVHKFLGFGGRSLKPIVIGNNPNSVSQFIWSDAVFIRHVLAIQTLGCQQLLKLSVLAAIYGSADLAYFCLAHYDEKNGTTLALDFLVRAGG